MVGTTSGAHRSAASRQGDTGTAWVGMRVFTFSVQQVLNEVDTMDIKLQELQVKHAKHSCLNSHLLLCSCGWCNAIVHKERIETSFTKVGTRMHRLFAKS